MHNLSAKLFFCRNYYLEIQNMTMNCYAVVAPNTAMEENMVNVF